MTPSPSATSVSGNKRNTERHHALAGLFVCTGSANLQRWLPFAFCAISACRRRYSNAVEMHHGNMMLHRSAARLDVHEPRCRRHDWHCCYSTMCCACKAGHAFSPAYLVFVWVGPDLQCVSAGSPCFGLSLGLMHTFWTEPTDVCNVHWPCHGNISCVFHV